MADPPWPAIEEPELMRRLSLSDAEFERFVHGVAASVPPRPFDEEAYATACGYPWRRPDGSFELADGEPLPLAECGEAERERAVRRYAYPGSGRVPLIAIGSNGAPAALRRKFAHFERSADRSLLALRGGLHGVDVGAAPQPALYGSLPATLFASPGTVVGVALLWVTPAQFTQLVWSELSYAVGLLRAPFEAEDVGMRFERAYVFASRFGAFAPEGAPLALAAVPAERRTAEAVAQEGLLDIAAELAIGPESNGRAFVRLVLEDLATAYERAAASLWPLGRRFEHPGWRRFAAGPAG